MIDGDGWIHDSGYEGSLSPNNNNQKSLYLYEVVFVLTIMTIIIIFDYDDCHNDYDNINNSHDDYNDSDNYVALMVQDRLLSHLK